MYKLLVILLCGSCFCSSVSWTTHPTTSLSPTTSSDNNNNTSLKIGAFNIQTFGKSKYSKVAIRDYLIQIVTKYDVILIQEIKEKAQTMIFKFLADCQQHRNFDMALSTRLGRSSRYMEQYAVLYDADLVTLDMHTVYSDPSDIFHREPIVAQITTKSKRSSLTLVGLHSDPDDVPEELAEMANVYTWAVQQGYSSKALMMGDFNADCTYLKSSEYSSIQIYSDPSYVWLVDETADTTVSDNTDCAYDRFVAVGGAQFTNTTVDRFDVTFNLTAAQAKKVSDHYPIQTYWLI